MMKDLLSLAVESGSSDIHITEGKRPYVRRDGELVSLEKFPVVTLDMIEEMFGVIGVSEDVKKELQWDGRYTLEGEQPARFRVHIAQSIDGWQLSFRTIPAEVPTYDKLGLPAVVRGFTKPKNGLVLVTGVTGSGKSTTLASLIDHINETQNKRIITVEDPVEFVYEDKKSFIVQRELGSNFHSFSEAVKGAMRQDPDILLVGELRDIDTIHNAITLAETGHLVFGTLHTKSVAETFDRVIDVFPAGQQKQIRTQLANVTQGVLTQRLVKKKGGGRVPAVEAIVVTDAVRNLITKAKPSSEIEGQMTMKTRENGSQSMTQSLAQLYKKGIIDIETALEECGSAAEEKKLRSYLE